MFADDLDRLAALHSNGKLSDEEFTRAKGRVLGGAAAEPLEAVNGLRRSRSDRWLGGVCAGLGAATGLETWIWRLLFTVLALFGGTGLVVYILLWIFVPETA